MRKLILLPLALALTAPAVAADPGKPVNPDVAAAQRALKDPAIGEKMSRMGGALTRALMDIRVGELEAAVEGREATAADRRRTVSDTVGGPEEAARIEREVAGSGAQVQAMGSALADALPGIVGALSQAASEVEKAVANMPDPTYPRR